MPLTDDAVIQLDRAGVSAERRWIPTLVGGIVAFVVNVVKIGFDELILATGGSPRWLSGVPRAGNVFTLRSLRDSQAIRDALSEDPKVGELETREHMGRADQPPPYQPTTPEGLLGPRALKEYLEAAGLPELESIACTPEQLEAVQLAQQMRIAEALERIATALEGPRGAVESEALGDALSSW